VATNKTLEVNFACGEHLTENARGRLLNVFFAVGYFCTYKIHWIEWKEGSVVGQNGIEYVGSNFDDENFTVNLYGLSKTDNKKGYDVVLIKVLDHGEIAFGRLESEITGAISLTGQKMKEAANKGKDHITHFHTEASPTLIVRDVPLEKLAQKTKRPAGPEGDPEISTRLTDEKLAKDIQDRADKDVDELLSGCSDDAPARKAYGSDEGNGGGGVRIVVKNKGFVTPVQREAPRPKPEPTPPAPKAEEVVRPWVSTWDGASLDNGTCTPPIDYFPLVATQPPTWQELEEALDLDIEPRTPTPTTWDGAGVQSNGHGRIDPTELFFVPEVEICRENGKVRWFRMNRPIPPSEDDHLRDEITSTTRAIRAQQFVISRIKDEDEREKCLDRCDNLFDQLLILLWRKARMSGSPPKP